MDALITLIHPGETDETDEKTEVFAKVESTGRDEFAAAGERGFKASNKFTVWNNEYYGSPTSTNITLDVSGGKLTGLPSGLSGGTLLVTRGI